MNSYISRLVFHGLVREVSPYKLSCFIPCVNQKLRLSNLSEKNIRNVSTPKAGSCSSSQRFLEVNVHKCNLLSVRLKYSKKQKGKGKAEESDSDEEEEEQEDISDNNDDDDDELVKDYKDIVAHMGSLRVDSVIQKGLGMARNKAIDAFYAGNVRVNGQKVLKKSRPLTIGDETDLILGVSKTNSAYLNVSRVVIMNASQMDSDRLKVKLRRFKNLTVPKYKDGVKPSDSENQE